MAGYLNGLKKNLAKFNGREIRVSKALLMGENKKPLIASEARKLQKPRWDADRKKEASVLRGKNSKEEREDFAMLTEAIAGPRAEMFDFEGDNVVENGMGINLVGKVPQASISKQIKKIKKKSVELGPELTLKKCLKVKDRHHKKLEENVFRKGDELKKRREVRKAKAEINGRIALKYKKLLDS